MERFRKSRLIAILIALTLVLSVVFVPSAGAEQVKAEPSPVVTQQRVETPAADLPRPGEDSEFIGVATVAAPEDAAEGGRGTVGDGAERPSPWQYNYTAESWATYETALKDGLSASAAASALVPLNTEPVTGSFFAGWTTEAVNAVVNANSGRLCDSIGEGLNTNGVYNAGDFSRNTTFAAGDGWFSMTAAADFTGKAMGWKNMDRSATLNPGKVNAGADYPLMAANVRGLSEAEGIRFKLEITGGSVERILIGLSNCNTMVREQYALKLKGAYVGADGYINLPFDCFEAAFWGTKFSQDELEDVIVFIVEAYNVTNGTTVKVSDLRGYKTAAETAREPWEYNYTPESWAAYQAALKDGLTAEAASALLAPQQTETVTAGFFSGWTTDAVNAVVNANTGRLCDSIGDGLNTNGVWNAGDFSRNTTFKAGDGWFSMTATADFADKAMGWKNMDRSATLNPGKVNAGADYPFMAANVGGLSAAEGIRFKLEATGSVERILIGLSNCNTMVREQYALALKPGYADADGYINIPFGSFVNAWWCNSFAQSELEDVIVFIIEAYGVQNGTTVRVSDLHGYVCKTSGGGEEPGIPDIPDGPGFIYPEESEYVGAHYRATDLKVIKFDEMFPAGFTGDTSWDPMGIDGNGVIYFGYTGRRTDLIAGEEIEDFAVFSYDPEKDVVKFLGTFIEACKAANNYEYGEEIPKGHTKFYCIDNRMYMASQSFHDYKDRIDGDDGYLTKRGAHLFVYDIEKEILFDLSSKMPGGVWCEHQGVVAMNYMPELGKLVGFTHPLADLVFYDLATGTVDRYVNGIPWSLGNPLSREIIVSGDKVYLYRGVEDTGYRASLEWPVYCYDYGDDELYQTGDTMKGGFWNGQATTSDGKTTYISGCCGILYKMDMETGRVTLLRDMDLDGENVIGYTYSISMSPDETKLFYIPTARSPGRIYEYDIATNTASVVADVPTAVYCGSNIVTKDNWYYFTRFGSGGDWSGNPSLVAFKLESWE